MSELTDNQWKIAHAIAQKIVQNGAKADELKKAMAYLRTCTNVPDGGARFFKYLGNLVGGGDRIGHSKKTVEYYRGLNEACVRYLKPLQDSPAVMLEILGWAGRLIPYYKEAPIAELTDRIMEVETKSVKQEQVQAAAAVGFAEGQVVEATIENKDGNKVTYGLAGGIRLTQKEPKNAVKLSVNQQVQVEITEMRDSGVPKKIKIVGLA
ncbi:MAG: hypothetical protein VKJ24_13630 [Synechococcales bacterium]|nr:hypothetical protein [Synechococcales bacterium]